MTWRRGLVAVGVLALAFAARPAVASRAVQARLLADVDAVVPGQAFRLGVELRMEPEWHTYWQYAGDAGLPTRVEWTLPSGMTAGPLQWPLPLRWSDPGGLVSYGYADEVLLLTRVEPPARLRPGAAVTVTAAASWLACRQVCIPGDTILTLSLPVRPTSRPTHAELFARSADRVPRPLGPEVALRHQARRTAEGLQVDLQVRGGGVPLQTDADLPTFYPSAAEGFQLGPVARVATADEATGTAGVRLLLRPLGEALPTRLEGVLVYRLAGDSERRGGRVSLDLSAPAQGGLVDLIEAWQAPVRRPVAAYLLLAAVGGLLLNLMPCVLPVISLKILGLVSQSGQERAQVRRLGWAFSAGVVGAFALLAVVVILLRAGGRELGWGFQFQSPGFVVVMAALVFVLGLSLFGVFVVRLPGSQSSLGGLADRGGLLGSFFSGVLATVLATPCTAPFLGTALGFAFTQPAAVTFGVLMVVGAGMAVPYALLAIRPGWLRYLPRPGAWMERCKQLMGFLLMGTVLWLLWVLGKQLGVEAVVWVAAFLLALALASWVVGQWVDLRSSGRRRAIAWLAALAIAGGGYGLFVHPVLATEGRLAAGQTPAPPDGWLPFSTARVEQLVASGRMVFVDFTAEWCWTCKVNERTVLADPEVQARFAELDVALVRADWTSRNPEITRLLGAFGRSGVPLYVIFPAGRPDAPLVLPEVITKGLVLERLTEAGARGRG